MNLVWWTLHLLVGAFSALVCAYAGAHLARRDGRIGWRQLHRWRVLGALPLFALGLFQALHAESTQLACRRDAGVLACSVIRAGLLDSRVEALPEGALIGAEVDERVGSDHEGNPTLSRRVALVTRQGRLALTRFDQGDALAMQRQIVAFLADGRQPSLLAGVDDRPFHWLVAPMWLAFGLLVLAGRWD